MSPPIPPLPLFGFLSRERQSQGSIKVQNSSPSRITAPELRDLRRENQSGGLSSQTREHNLGRRHVRCFHF